MLQIDALAKQHERLAGRANQRKADIQSSKKKVEKLNSDLKKARDRIETAMKEIDNFKPVGGQIKAIQQEQAVLKVCIQTLSCFPDLCSLDCNIFYITRKFAGHSTP